MVQANELRIGNWITDDKGIPFKVDEIRHWYYSDAEPIPLTPEILEKCGFEREGLQCDYTLGDVDLYESGNGYRFGISGYVMQHEIGSLHQLQNLNYALTGVELTINL
jgi:hypothetical protein